MASGLITSWQIDGETMETVTDFVLEIGRASCRERVKAKREGGRG